MGRREQRSRSPFILESQFRKNKNIVMEQDKEHFDKGCERFNRECKGEIVTKQMSLFDDESKRK